MYIYLTSARFAIYNYKYVPRENNNDKLVKTKKKKNRKNIIFNYRTNIKYKML